MLTKPLRNGRVSKALKVAVGRCEVCGWRDPMGDAAVLHAHHVVPVVCGGATTEENMAILCPNHHALAHRVGQIRRRDGAWSGPATKPKLIKALRHYEDGVAQFKRAKELIESLRPAPVEAVE